MIKQLRRETEYIRAEVLQAHLRKLGPLSAREENLVTALSHTIANKLLHTPTVRLKRTTDERYLFGLGGNESE